MGRYILLIPRTAPPDNADPKSPNLISCLLTERNCIGPATGGSTSQVTAPEEEFGDSGSCSCGPFRQHHRGNWFCLRRVRLPWLSGCPIPGPIHVSLVQRQEQLVRAGYAEHRDSHRTGGMVRVQRDFGPKERRQQLRHRSGKLRSPVRQTRRVSKPDDTNSTRGFSHRLLHARRKPSHGRNPCSGTGRVGGARRRLAVPGFQCNLGIDD